MAEDIIARYEERKGTSEGTSKQRELASRASSEEAAPPAETADHSSPTQPDMPEDYKTEFSAYYLEDTDETTSSV